MISQVSGNKKTSSSVVVLTNLMLWQMLLSKHIRKKLSLSAVKNNLLRLLKKRETSKRNLFFRLTES